MVQLTKKEQLNGNLETIRPRLGFLGTGWVGRHRLRAIQRSGLAEVVAVADPNADARWRAVEFAPEAEQLPSLDALLTADLDGIVIATPTALHAEQVTRALEQGMAVFCQKPLARTANETAQVLAAARAANRLLAVDLSYRHIDGVERMRELIREGALGHIYAVDLTCHNAHGPDKEWFYDPALAGGGCVLDLGIQLVDLMLWLLDFPATRVLSSHMFREGRRLPVLAETVEDYAVAQLELESGAVVQMASSWKAPIGADAVIEVTIHGTESGLHLRNRSGSFYSFTVEQLYGTTRNTLAQSFEDWGWGGRAAVAWTQRLAQDCHYDPSVAHLQQVMDLLDTMYGRA